MERKSTYLSTLRRREFLKVGLATGVAVGMPAGIIPMAWNHKAEAAEALTGIPAETRWTVATKAMTGATAVTSKVLWDVVGQDQYDEMLVQIWTEAGKGSKEIADALGLTGDDAKSVAEAVRSVVIVSMGPECKYVSPEATPRRAVNRLTECCWWNRQKELGFSGELCNAGCPAYNGAFAKSLNPNVTTRRVRARPKGDAYCEYVFMV